MRFKSVLICWLILSLGVLAFPASAAEPTRAPGVSAASAILYHPATGSVLFTKNADLRRPIASTTKIVTALTVLRSEPDLDRTVMVPCEACGIEGSSLYLKAGEMLSVRDLLYGLLLASANDAAAALAVTNAGSIDAFADRMNAVSRELGLENSHFCNPHGLDVPEHYSTARDLAIIAAAALEDETFREIVSTKRYTIPCSDGGQRYLYNHNKLLNLYPGCIGVKTGFTKKSGRCLIGAAERDGITLISVTLNAPDDWNDHAALLDFGFSLIETKTLLKAGEYVFDCPVVGGDKERLRVTNAEEISLALPKGVDQPTREIRLSRFLAAPIAKGQIVGSIVYRMNGKTVGYSPLVATDAVELIKTKKGLFHK